MEDRFKNRTQFYISPKKGRRAEFVEFLESEGFVCNHLWDRDDVLESFLPVLVEMKERTFSRIWNVTCAAGAAGAKLIVNDEEFYKLYAELQDS